MKKSRLAEARLREGLARFSAMLIEQRDTKAKLYAYCSFEEDRMRANELADTLDFLHAVTLGEFGAESGAGFPIMRKA
ncbi:hypothetical protein ACFWY9_28660 [Amycolatopsis sp. NPDC059027]|uniref:hypothetical protein n=1 Tax=Amycolatopsis sp. NPDC059027 TaxID=3346709 RepID=UPI0036702234